MWFLWDFEWKRLYILLFFISYLRDPNFKNWNCFWFPLPSESLKVWEFELPNPLWYSAFFKYPVFSNVLIKIQNEKKKAIFVMSSFPNFHPWPIPFPCNPCSPHLLPAKFYFIKLDTLLSFMLVLNIMPPQHVPNCFLNSSFVVLLSVISCMPAIPTPTVFTFLLFELIIIQS